MQRIRNLFDLSPTNGGSPLTAALLREATGDQVVLQERATSLRAKLDTLVPWAGSYALETTVMRVEMYM